MPDEYIDRREVIKLVEKAADGYDYLETDAKAFIEDINAIQPADVRPVKEGHWTAHILKNANVPWGYDCSECDAWFVIGQDYIGKYHHCPHCGAKMEVQI